ELLGPISDAELLEHYARCRAVFFGPWNEDYGFVTLEAFQSGKAVITCADSGGPAELVQDGVTGHVVEPEPRAVARALEALALEAPSAERRGQAARAAAREHTWERAIEKLVRW